MGTTGKRILLLVVLIALWLGGFSSATERSASKQELQRIKREMREKKKELIRADRKERSILSELETIDKGIQIGRAELVDQQQRLNYSEAALRDVEQNNAVLNRELFALKRHYSRRLRELYKMSRDGYVLAILSPNGLGPTLKRIKYLALIADRDQANMRAYGKALQQLADQQAKIADKQNELLAHQRVVAATKAELEARKRKKAIILTSVRHEKGQYEQSLHELEEASASLWAMIKRSGQEMRASKATYPASKQSRETEDRQRLRLPWPLEGQVLTRFGLQRHPQFGTMVYRRGIEIEAHEGESVRAVRDGQVVFADWYKGYGMLMILDHGGGFYTLYGNLSRLDMKKGDRVTKSQVIGLAGETGSLKGAKLYFEIRRDGEAQDPLQWLAKK
jgi:septal ring factor EnvC (AmiA/AmiB activator)